MTALTNREKQANWRESKKKEGLVKFQIYLKPENVSKVMAYAEQLK